MLADLRSAAWALSALRVAAEADVLAAIAAGTHDVGTLARTTGLEAHVLGPVLDVLAAYDIVSPNADGFALTQEGADLARRGSLLSAELTATVGQARAFVDDARGGALHGAWRHVDPEVIRAQGIVSNKVTVGMFGLMLRAIPELERLARPGAVFLDVGLGAAGGAIAFCRRFPSLRVVGLEPLPAARLEAHAAIGLAGLEDRIEVRAQRVEDLDAKTAFDGAYVASMFLDDATLAKGLAKVRGALAPGAIVLLGGWNEQADPKLAATSRLRWQLWGGGPRSAREVARIAEAAGLVDVREAPASGDLAPLWAKAP